MSHAITRRTALGASVGAGLTLLGTRPVRADTLPGDFPSGIPLYREVFKNWDGVITSNSIATCIPANAQDVLQVVRWAKEQKYTVRARGYRHSWSPLTVAAGESGSVILLDTTKRLTSMKMSGTDVRLGAGAEMTDVLAYLSLNGRSVLSAPAPGDVTVAGVLAVSGHGTAVPAAGESAGEGRSFGTLSNLVREFTAVVWDATANDYVLKTFARSDPEAAAFLTSVGRTFLTEVVLQTVPEYKLRCQCYTDIPTKELFAAPGSGGRTLSSLLDKAGRVGLIWYTYTDYPWVQQWTPTPTRPLLSRPVFTPFNFPFADNLPSPVPQLLGQLIAGNSTVAPAFGKAVVAATATGLTATLARDMWGSARNFIHFVKPTTLRVSAGSHAVITRRADVQRVVSEFAAEFTRLQATWRAAGRYPVNSCVEVRVTGIDTPDQVVGAAEAPALSAAAPVPGHPEYDTVVWLDALTLPGTPGEYEAYADIEKFIWSNYSSYAHVRPEWAKRWATSSAGPWTDSARIADTRDSFDRWDWASGVLTKYDPHRLFTTDLLERIEL